MLIFWMFIWHPSDDKGGGKCRWVRAVEATRSSVFHLSTSLSLDIYFFSTLWDWAPCVLFVIFDNLYQWHGLSLLLFFSYTIRVPARLYRSMQIIFSPSWIGKHLNFPNSLDFDSRTLISPAHPLFLPPSSAFLYHDIPHEPSIFLQLFPAKREKLKLSALCGWNSKEYRKKFQHITRFTLESQQQAQLESFRKRFLRVVLILHLSYIILWLWRNVIETFWYIDAYYNI